ncbi:MAG: hypothetical protein AVDCRST_MAG19-2511 [uncultured Thermomicrobiales bacterium]|uniref:Uncharacterized protein n=1 Tax=uncultured Thermomicrobiales bacterium TaxID=1645740 RepID=A0A6J4V761_9BACT|nr:MAG: hypothetical protein AVDCRST_MAG19-2511 [uncultured Thermomicrobiales bacterium]
MAPVPVEHPDDARSRPPVSGTAGPRGRPGAPAPHGVRGSGISDGYPSMLLPLPRTGGASGRAPERAIPPPTDRAAPAGKPTATVVL